MKKLLPLLLSCLILGGCGVHTPEETIPPTESVAGETCFPEEYGGAVQSTALNLSKVQGIVLFGENLLLLSVREASTLTLVHPETFDIQASVTFDCLLMPEDLMFTPEGALCFYSQKDQALVLLDHTLRETDRIRLPAGVQGQAVLWGNTVYYCTASEVRAWDLETDIRRRVKEMSRDSQEITGVLMEGAVLQCTVKEGSQLHTLFLSSSDGRLLHHIPGPCAIYSHTSGFYGSISPGSYPLHIFGHNSAHLLTPRDLTAACFFLPSQGGALTVSSGILDYYDLATGHRIHTMTLEPFLTVTSAVPLSDDSLLLLVHDPALKQDLLVTWNIGKGSPTAVRENIPHVQPYYSADAPDAAGLDQCARLARELGSPLGLTIRFWEDAAVPFPDHTLESEHQIPLIQRELELLDRRLRQYPKSLLTKTAARFSSLNLCLVRSVTGPGCGTFFLNGSDAYIILPMGSGTEQALSHGLFHAMEIHIFAESHVLDQWNTLNPAGFQYDYDYGANLRRDSGVYLFQEQRSFVDTFSMSYPREDRARIFEYAMAEGQDALFLPPPMQKKLQTLCSGIREAYQIEGNEGLFSWEQYLH